MRKKISKDKKWKSGKKLGFHFYFVFIALAVSLVTVIISVIASLLMTYHFKQELWVSPMALILGFGLIIGLILAYVAGILFIRPITKLQKAMTAVTKGDLLVKVEEKSSFKEIANINHSFNIMMKELQSTHNIQKDFLSNVSHEFKTPLSRIRGCANLLQDGKLTEEEKDGYVKEILETTKEMSQLITDILLLSKLTNQAIDYKKEKVYVDELIRRVVVLLEENWEEKDIELDANLQEVVFEANSGLLQNVFRNLIENAIKFSPKGGKITLYLGQNENDIEFYVIDEGEGVSQKDEEHIFEHFYQGDSSHKQEGNGLGLPLVKEILKTFDGEVYHEKVKEGCKFTVIIPK